MDMDSYGEDEYGEDYDDEMDMEGVGASGNTDGGSAIYQYGN